MKADIPNSIIIGRDEDGFLHHSYWTTDQQLVPFEDTVYIRKDALVDWLQLLYEEYSERSKAGEMVHQIAGTYLDVLNHINEM